VAHRHNRIQPQHGLRGGSHNRQLCCRQSKFGDRCINDGQPLAVTGRINLRFWRSVSTIPATAVFSHGGNNHISASRIEADPRPRSQADGQGLEQQEDPSDEGDGQIADPVTHLA